MTVTVFVLYNIFKSENENNENNENNETDIEEGIYVEE
jgi:hypothetical protein